MGIPQVETHSRFPTPAEIL
jgi:pimeloyl-ACP methyl ester carboxylesterase